MYQLISPLKGKTYEKLVNFLIERSDSFLFHLPNMGKTLVNERNAEFMAEYPIGYSFEENQDLHTAYVERMNSYLNILRNDIAESYFDTGYLDQYSSIEIQVYYATVSKRTKLFFSQTNDFSKWMYPEFPEDPCFIHKGKCIFHCITHEKLYFLYLDGAEIKRFLKQNKIQFIFFPEEQPPTYKTRGGGNLSQV